MILGAIFSQQRRADRPLGEVSISRSGLWQIFPKENTSILDCHRRGGELGPAQALLPHLKLFWDASLSWVWKARATHMMYLWGMHVLGGGRDWQEAWLHCFHSLWSCWSYVPVRPGYCWPSSAPPWESVLQYPGYGLREGVCSHSIFREGTSLSSLLKHLFWLL